MFMAEQAIIRKRQRSKRLNRGMSAVGHPIAGMAPGDPFECECLWGENGYLGESFMLLSVIIN